MISLKHAAAGIAQYLARELNFDHDNAETIRYGMEIILGSLIKVITILGLSYWLGITPYVMAALTTSSILRLLSGGVHCSTYMRCLVFGAAIAVLIGKMALTFGPFMDENSMLILVMLTSLLGLYFVIKWAPADCSSKPIERKDKREKYKKLSLFYIVIWTVIILLFILFHSDVLSIFSFGLASISGFLFQIFSLCPAGYRLIGHIDNMLSKFLPEGR